MGRLARAARLLLVLSTLGCRETAARSSAEPRTASPNVSARSAAPQASAAASGQRAPRERFATLSAKNALGVPLHPSPSSDAVSARLPDGARVRVLEIAAEGRWNKIRSLDGVEGWVTRRYLRDVEGDVRPERASLSPTSPWASRSACLAEVAAGRRLPRAPSRARVLAWNLHWFPDGRPGHREGAYPADIEWLACAITYLDADLVALSELKAHARGKQELTRLLGLIGSMQNSNWDARLDDCEPPVAQHVGLAWNTGTVRAGDVEVVSELNPHGSACEGSLRPGLGGRFSFPGGLDLQVVSTHWKSGGERRSIELRKKTLSALPSVLERSARRDRDDDLLVIGDFNTMGCPDCSPKSSADEEKSSMSLELSRMAKPFLLLPSEPSCSHYFSGNAGLLDLAVASRSMAELGDSPHVVVSGFCGELSCQSLPEGGPLSAQRALSDHCPIVVDLVDKDLDPL